VRLQHGQAMLQSQLFDWAGGELHPSPGGAVWLGQHGGHVKLLRQQGIQGGGGKMRGARKNDLQVCIPLHDFAAMFFQLCADPRLLEL
jgi:hypothetical protein